MWSLQDPCRCGEAGETPGILPEEFYGDQDALYKGAMRPTYQGMFISFSTSLHLRHE